MAWENNNVHIRLNKTINSYFKKERLRVRSKLCQTLFKTFNDFLMTLFKTFNDYLMLMSINTHTVIW